MMFFFVSGRPNLRRKVRELMSTKLANEESGWKYHRCSVIGRIRCFGALMREHECPSSSVAVSALQVDGLVVNKFG
jgi:hypothetical protein